MEHLLVLREKHGSVFATQLPDGRVVPWKPLSVGEFLEFDATFRRGVYSSAYLEHEIFDKCVLDEYLKTNKDEQKAGTISLIVSHIMMVSGPSSLEEIGNMLALKRLEASGIIYQLAGVIIQAFPGYTMEDILSMDYQTLMLRVAQAEDKLVRTGMLQEPLTLERNQPTASPGIRPDTSKMLQNYYEQQGIQDGPVPPPAPLRSTGQTVITAGDVNEHASLLTGHAMTDRIVVEHQMVQETASIYTDYLEQIRKGEKVTPKTHQQRVAEAKQRMQANKKAFAEAMAKKRKEEEEQRRALEEQLKKRATRRRRR